MRLYLTTTRSTDNIPFNYQSLLTGVIHKWAGRDNIYHGGLSQYSFSWLQNVKAHRNYGIRLNQDATFFISAHDGAFLKQILSGILKDPALFVGASIRDVQITGTPVFSAAETFMAASPVLIKRKVDEKERHFTYDDERAGIYLTETLQHKLEAAGLPAAGVRVRFDTSYHSPRAKIIRYREI